MPTASYLLEQVKRVLPEVIREEYPDRLIASGKLLYTSTELPPGTEIYTFALLTRVGYAAVLANGANDIPEVNSFIEEKFGRVRPVATAVKYTYQDLQKLQLGGPINKLRELTLSAREAVEIEIDRVCYLGDNNFGLLGMLNHPNVPVYVLPNDGNSNGGVNSTRFIHKTPAQQYRDLCGFAAATRIATYWVHKPEIIGVDVATYESILAQQINDQGETVLSLFKRIQMELGGIKNIIPIPFLESMGIGGTNVMVSLSKAEAKIKWHLVQDFTTLPPQARDFGFKIPCFAQIGGVQVNQPFSMRYAMGA